MNNTHPLEIFRTQFNLAQNCGMLEPTAATLATCDQNGNPSARVILIKLIDNKGPIFFTNLASRKAKELRGGKAALCFYYTPLDSQIRLEGIAEQVEDQVADNYFASRDRSSQLGAWASKQSQVMVDEDELTGRLELYSKKFANLPVTRPPFWSGFRIIPSYYEFWQKEEHRLHQRTVYLQTSAGWQITSLFP